VKKVYEFNLPITPQSLELLPGKLLDAETFVRLNPLWIVKAFKQEGDTFQAELKDYSTDKEFTLSGSIDNEMTSSFQATLSGGDYELVSIEQSNNNFQATVIYGDPEFEEESEQERHTVMWLRGIQEYLRLYQKKTINTVIFRYIMNRIVLTMSPSQRKICLMLLRITAVELLVILIIVIGYVFFVLK
jgi:hypothetical protein